MNFDRNDRKKGVILLGIASLLWMFGPKVPLDRYFSPAPPINPIKAVEFGTTREVGNFEDISTPPPKEVDRSTTKVISECLADLKPFTSQPFSLKELADHLRASKTASSRIEVQNLHIKTSEGKQMRLMIAPSDSTEFDGLEANLYSVDAEGLPIIKQLPLSIRPRDIESARNYFLNMGTLIFSETTYLYKDEPNEISGKITYNFDEIAGAELSQNGRFLGCSKSISSKSVVCKCL